MGGYSGCVTVTVAHYSGPWALDLAGRGCLGPIAVALSGLGIWSGQGYRRHHHNRHPTAGTCSHRLPAAALRLVLSCAGTYLPELPAHPIDDHPLFGSKLSCLLFFRFSLHLANFFCFFCYDSFPASRFLPLLNHDVICTPSTPHFAVHKLISSRGSSEGCLLFPSFSTWEGQEQ